MRPFFSTLVLLFPLVSQSQKVFSEIELVAAVKKFHPVAKAAALNIDVMKAGQLSARAAFDPLFSWSNSQKNFDAADYYNRNQAELKIPTWYGIDFYAGTEYLSGEKANPEETKGKISFAGVNIPLVQNLVMDKRRAALKTARLLVNESEMHQRSAVNDLLLEALQAYWTWWQHFHSLQLIDSSLKNAEKRFSMVKTAFLLGDRPAIDTIETLTQVQMFSVYKSEARMQLIKSKIELSGFLWKENNEAYQLPEDVIPSSSRLSEPILPDLLQQGLSHPALMAYDYKLSSLGIEKKLKFQSLLPSLDLKYQQLSKGYELVKNISFRQNYRYGITFSMPLRLSEGRGEYRKAKLMIEQTGLERLNKQVQIQNKIKQYFTEWQQTSNQLSIQEKMISNYLLLQRGEEVKFYNGESSLFLINSREQKTLEAKQKLVELQTKNVLSLVAAKWAAGIL